MRDRNYYILLELNIDPPEMREDKIREAINKKRIKWSSFINHPTKKIEAKMNLELIPKIEAKLFGSKEGKLDEVKKAKEIIYAKKADQLSDFDRIFTIISKKDYISIEELGALKQKFPLINETIDRRCQKILCEIVVDKMDTDRILYKRIEANLKIIGEDNLYTFLKVPKKSSLAMIKTASKSLYDEIRSSSRKDTVLTIKSELQGFCDQVFKNIESKINYDDYLKIRELKVINEYLDILGSKRFILKEEFLEVADLMKSRKYPIEYCKEYILLYCLKKKISIVDEEDAYFNIKKPSKNTGNCYADKVLSKVDKTPAIGEFVTDGDEIEILQTIAGDGEIIIEFKRPVGAKGIEIWRKEGAMPKTAGDGIKLNITREGKVVDKGLDSDKVYGYLLFSIFERNGKLQYSDGVTTFATPKYYEELEPEDLEEAAIDEISEKEIYTESRGSYYEGAGVRKKGNIINWILEFFD